MTEADLAAKLAEVRDLIAGAERSADHWRERYTGTLARCRELVARSVKAEARAAEYAVRAMDAEREVARLAVALVDAHALLRDQARQLERAFGFLDVRELPVIDAECEPVTEGGDADVS